MTEAPDYCPLRDCDALRIAMKARILELGDVSNFANLLRIDKRSLFNYLRYKYSVFVKDKREKGERPFYLSLLDLTRAARVLGIRISVKIDFIS